MKYLIVLMMCFATLAQAQTDNGMFPMDEFRNPRKRTVLQVPGFDGYQALKCDFHMHTVFSDGHVWPTVRIQEAWTEGLDVISITDHVEYAPHSEDVRVDHNRSWELAKDAAAETNLILIKGTEITRNTPPGHFNAIFVDDVSGYVEDRSGNEKDKEAVMKAVEQKAFIFWNHPGWKWNTIEGSYEWIDFVDNLNKEKNLHGIEVFNGFRFHKKALDWCVDNNLTVMANTDMHNLVKHEYRSDESVHRTMTLVFAGERSAEAVREALEAGRTVAWSSNYIAGKEENVSKLFYACVSAGPRFYTKTVKRNNDTESVTHYYELINNSDLYFELVPVEGEGGGKIVLYPKSSQVITVPEGKNTVSYDVVTAFVRSNKNLRVDIDLK